MRIRKHAKISPLIYAASSLKPGTVLQTHFCQLNQSPWDVMSFSPTPPPLLPPPSSQVNKNDSFQKNGSLEGSIGAAESASSMKMATDDGVTGAIEARKWEYSDGGIEGGSAMDTAEEGTENPGINRDRDIAVYCCKTDGKGWKCKQQAAEGNSYCKHHLSQVRNYNNGTPAVAKKADKVAADTRRRARPKKPASTSSTSNPYEFYYYSGFGPRWGKKRGENSNTSGGSRHVPRNVDQKHETEPSALSQIIDEGLDIEDEIEYEEEDESETGRKRARKPIKARSLKSLM